MSVRSILMSGLILTSGRVSGALFGLIRNVLIARFISIENFGIAATFAVVISVVELISDIGIDRMIVQAKDGATEIFQKNAQFVHALRGIATSILIFVCASPIAVFFKIPDVIWAFQILALTPLLKGFIHLDIARVQREMNFLPAAVIIFVPQFIVMCLAIPFCLVFDDYRAALYLSMLQVFLQLCTSHALANRLYRWAVTRETLERIFHFGWPLVLNGFIVGLISQGDKALVGRFFSLEVFGVFTAAYGLVFLFASIVVSILQSYFLPMLSKDSENSSILQKRSLVVLQISAVIGLMLSLGTSMLGPSILLMLYGPQFETAIPFLALIGIFQAIRMARSCLNTVAIASRLTTVALYMSLSRVIGFGLAITFAVLGSTIDVLLICSVVGELIAFITGIVFLSYYGKISIRDAVPSLLLFSIIGVVCSVFSENFFIGKNWFFEIGTGSLFLAGILLVIILCMKRMRSEFLYMLRDPHN